MQAHETYCEVCGRPGDRGRHLCSAHQKRRADGDTTPVGPARGGPAGARLHESPLHRLLEAALAYADADSEDDVAFQRAKDNLRKAAKAYARGCPVAAVRLRVRRVRLVVVQQLALPI